MATYEFDLFPEIKPYNTGTLVVEEAHEAPEGAELHTLHYEESGNPDGPAALYVHGGPGAGCSPRSARFFDPAFYRIVILDQRGAGLSTPSAELRNNDTWTLVADIERLREHLGIERWGVLLGGSWGSTLTLAYTQTHADRVRSVILRGVFLFDDASMRWLFQEGAGELCPDAWEQYLAAVPEGERGDMLAAFDRLLADPETCAEAARAFVQWELSISKVHVDPEVLEAELKDPIYVLPFARFEVRFFRKKGWLKSDTHLLDGCPAIDHLPIAIVHGRQDIVCRPSAAWQLHKRLPNSTIDLVPGAGHSDSEPGLIDRLVAATERMKSVLQ